MNQFYSKTPEFATIAPPVASKDGLLVALHSAIGDLKAQPTGLWYLLRLMDSDGNGWVDTSFAEIGLHLKCHNSTIYRWLKQGRGLWFRSYRKLVDGGVRVYYVSITKVCEQLQIRNLGHIGLVDVQSLTRSGIKAACTLIDALGGQRQANYACKLSLPKAERSRVIDPTTYFDQSSDNTIGARRPSYMVLKGATLCPHISQSTIASNFDVTPGTIKRRLSDAWRIDRGLEPITKVRVVTQLDKDETANIMAFLHGSPRHLFDRDPLTGKYRFIKFKFNRFYRMGGNIYQNDIPLTSRKFQRSRIKDAVDRANSLTPQPKKRKGKKKAKKRFPKARYIPGSIANRISRSIGQLKTDKLQLITVEDKERSDWLLAEEKRNSI